jgi:hypothetical protein
MKNFYQKMGYCEPVDPNERLLVSDSDDCHAQDFNEGVSGIFLKNFVAHKFE